MLLREEAIAQIDAHAPSPLKKRGEVPSFFGENALDACTLKERLPPHIFQALQEGRELTVEVAAAIAEVMKEWALERGATHFCHWFQPLTDLTAEKHDAFFYKGREGEALARFDAAVLLRGEPDASSFPSGGLRTTFEARGYTAWDAQSPAFILGRTLMIPTMFVSWGGEALDKKTPLLRSIEALDREAVRIVRLFGDQQTKRVIPTLSGEQEFFLIDKRFYHQRPDLVMTGRTLFGARPAKGQELQDQYFGVMPARILHMLEDLEYELMRIGVPIQTRHNEVAPAQYEVALNYQSANLSSDQHMLLMQMLGRIADKHAFACLMHEKPFAGVNGSGKHSNWSLATDRGHNLLEPGDSPRENAQFLLFCAAVVRAVHRHAPLLRCAVASASNDHRLGLHEAPPAIMSVFLGEQLYDIFDQLKNGEKRGSKKGGVLRLGITPLPHIPRHCGDRNRTSPFAFTGNKFEFRAVGSLANLAKPNTVLNTAVAESLAFFAARLEKAHDFERELQTLLSEETRTFWPIIYEGDNYQSAWVEEAKKRGLPHLPDTVSAADAYVDARSCALFEHFSVYSKRELESLREIALEKYITHIGIEARMSSEMVHTQIFPAVLDYLSRLGGALNFTPKIDHALLHQIEEEVTALNRALAHLDALVLHASEGSLREQAEFARDALLPAMETLRRHTDALELLVDDRCWPLPKYREMLFIR